MNEVIFSEHKEIRIQKTLYGMEHEINMYEILTNNTHVNSEMDNFFKILR